MAPLTDQDKALLDFAGRWYRLPGAMAEAIQSELGMSQTRYWTRVNVLIDRPEALAYAPSTVNRLRGRRSRLLHDRSLRARGVSLG